MELIREFCASTLMKHPTTDNDDDDDDNDGL
jgi:hypothetical protein